MRYFRTHAVPPQCHIRRMMPYERFRAWQLCHALTMAVHQSSELFPKWELYGLTSQSRRAAFSAAANIAEGSAKRGPREFRRYLDVAMGSLAELAYCLHLARDLGYLSADRWVELEQLRDEAGRVTWGLYRAISERTRDVASF